MQPTSVERPRTVVLASPSAKLRRQWRLGIADLTIVAEVTGRANVARSLATFRPTLLLLDTTASASGWNLGDLRRLSPSTKVILLSRAPVEREALAAVKAGAKGYCDARVEPALLCRAVKRVLSGEVWVGRKIISRLIEELTDLTDHRQLELTKPARARPDRRLGGLSPRETDVVGLLAGGHRNSEIARRLGLAEKTIKAHMSTIFRKLGVSNRLQLALLLASRPHTRR